MKTGLVVIDMLNDFQDGALANPAAEDIVGPLKKLIKAARANNDWVVIYGNDAHKPGDLEFNIFGVHAVAGSDGAAVIDAIAPQEGDEIVNKRYYSTFTETDLDSICKIHGIGRLVMVGQHTDCCVRHTSYDAYVRAMRSWSFLMRRQFLSRFRSNRIRNANRPPSLPQNDIRCKNSQHRRAVG